VRLWITTVLSSVSFLLSVAPSTFATETTTVVLVWNANTESDVAGYRVHYGTASAPYSSLVAVSSPTATISNLTNGYTYTFAVTAYNTAGAESLYSDPVSYTVGSAQVVPTAVLANISTRADVQTGENVAIGGFIIDGIIPKKVALRALGPSLSAAGVTGVLRDPYLQLIDSTGSIIASNDGWNVPGEEVSAYGLAPKNAKEAALVTTLSPGSYSAVVSGVGSTSGVGLFELYDLTPDAGRVANISTRGRVETGDEVMIGGFILSSQIPNKVIVRAIGPSLASLGVKGLLADPVLELYDSYGTLLESNDNWRSTQEVEIQATSIPPTDDREAALVITLAPGAYSTIVRGANSGTGVALVEVYALN
jgi:hypothetical protein